MSGRDVGAEQPASDQEPREQRTQWYLGDEPIGDTTADLLRRADLGSQLAGVAALYMGRALDEWARNLRQERP